jgi:glycosyltransferase involved in cell wall biosynthesis
MYIHSGLLSAVTKYFKQGLGFPDTGCRVIRKKLREPSVMIVCTSYLPKVNGTTLAIHALATELRNRGIRTRILAKYRDKIVSRNNDEGIPVTRIGVDKRGFVGSISFVTLALHYIRELAANEEGLVLHAHGLVPGLALSLNRFLTGQPFIVTFHQLAESNEIPWIRLIVQRLVCTSATLVTVPSEIAKRTLLEQLWHGNEAKISIIPNVLPTLWFQSNVEFDTAFSSERILFVGDLSKNKRVDLLLRVMRLVLHRLPTASCEIIGVGQQYWYLVDLVRKLGLQQTVRFRGRLSRAEVIEAYNRCALVVLLSKHELFPTVLLEASLMGRPIVATPTIGSRSIILPNETGILTDSSDERDIASSILLLLGNKELWLRLAKGARAHALKIVDPERTVATLQKHYASLLKDRA